MTPRRAERHAQKAGGWKSTVLGGEGLVVKLTGPGRAYVQTRSPNGFLDWLIPSSRCSVPDIDGASGAHSCAMVVA